MTSMNITTGYAQDFKVLLQAGKASDFEAFDFGTTVIKEINSNEKAE